MSLPDPTNLQNYVLAILAAASVILPVATGFAVKVICSVGEVRRTIDDLKERQSQQNDHLVSQGRQIVDVALATPPPTNNPSPVAPTNIEPAK